ncbi:YgfZ/GcvT domain-containing protein [Novosphingopyxis sp.]|uniref:CAF17-like 4Fe-4S cluster assembly/insertion protein YgfZ n=1 Tax=Novosphingopyxis sp. TaxID=2709690 RepID=UPI003B5AC330
MASSRLFDRALIRVTATEPGEDVRAFLQGLVTNDTRRLDEGPVWAALLTAQGKVLFDFLLWADGNDVLIDCEETHAAGLIRRLSIYRLRRKIAFEREEGLGVYWRDRAPAKGTRRSSISVGPKAGAHHPTVPAGLLPSQEHADPRLSELGHRWIDSISDADTDASEGWRAHRLSLGVLEGEAELGQDATLWLECNAIELHGVAFDKGCYVGQENTARMNWRQKINRRLVVVPLADADPKRQRIAYPQLGVSVEHRRAEDMASLELPDWQRSGIEKAAETSA